MARRGASWIAVPAQSIRNTRWAAEPSSTGTSGPSTSISALSMPQPVSAAITCSTVPTRTVGSAGSARTVASLVSTTRSKRAGMLWPGLAGPEPAGLRSVRRNTMPWLGAAGCSAIFTRRPLCRPIPTQSIEVFSVLWQAIRNDAIPAGTALGFPWDSHGGPLGGQSVLHTIHRVASPAAYGRIRNRRRDRGQPTQPLPPLTSQ